MSEEEFRTISAICLDLEDGISPERSLFRHVEASRRDLINAKEPRLSGRYLEYIARASTIDSRSLGESLIASLDAIGEEYLAEELIKASLGAFYFKFLTTSALMAIALSTLVAMLPFFKERVLMSSPPSPGMQYLVALFFSLASSTPAYFSAEIAGRKPWTSFSSVFVIFWVVFFLARSVLNLLP